MTNKALATVGQLTMVQVTFILLIIGSLVYLFWASRSIEAVTESKNVRVKEGLRIKGKNFTIEGEKFRIMSGAIHYFRVPSEYWDDRLLKLKAMGLNTVETYIPWNMHEPEPGVFNFEDDLSIGNFISLAQTYGIYVIIRPGPYICAEWDLGGLPSWLLRDPNMNLRSSYKPFLQAVDRYFNKLLPMLAEYQYSKGGPVIAFQIENEYGSYDTDLKYLRHLKQAFKKGGIDELLFMSDNDGGLFRAHLKGTLQTINFQTNANKMIDLLEEKQPDKPVFVTEFWSGWFDHWGEKHHIVKTQRIEKALKTILDRGASFNFYMFHGGTNFGFMNGANTYSRGNGYKPTISSYDYDAPVSETGDLTKKFYALKKVIKKHAPKGSVPDKLPWVPDSLGRRNYGKIAFEEYMPLEDILKHQKSVKQKDVVTMEMLPINNDAGQSYGYILYSTKIPKSSKRVTIHEAADRVTVIVNQVIIKDVEVLRDKHEVKLPALKSGDENLLQILVENCGRINYEHAIGYQRKGINGYVDIDGKKLHGWEIYPLEFKRNFVDKLDEDGKWKSNIPKKINTPALYRSSIWVDRAPHDAILYIKGWERGAVFLNGKNLGRYDAEGPQRTLYIPRAFLKSGKNSVIMFESGVPASSMEIDTVSDLIWDETEEFHI